MTLINANLNEKYTLSNVNIKDRKIFLTLYSLGFKKGENIKVLYKTKNAHAIVVNVLGRKIALSKSVAQNVEVY